MAVNAVVVTGTLPTSGSQSYTSAGFGDPQAAIIIASLANSTNNPQDNAGLSIGFYDGTTQAYCNSFSEHNVGDSDSAKQLDSGKAVKLNLDGDGDPVLDWTAAWTTNGITLTLSTGSPSYSYHVQILLINGLSNAAVGVNGLSTSTSYNITTPGFRANLVFGLSHGGDAGTSLAVAGLQFGVAHINASDTVVQGMLAMAVADAASAANSYQRFSTKGVFGQHSSVGTTLSWYGQVSANANGFSIATKDNSDSAVSPNNDDIAWLALEFPSADDAWVSVSNAAKTSAGTQAYTGTGFTPKALLIAACGATTENASVDGVGYAIGMGGPASVESCIGICDEDAVDPTDTESFANTSNIFELRTHNGTVDCVADLQSLDADGWTLNYSDGSASARKMLAVAIGNSAGGTTVTVAPGKGAVTVTGKAPTVARTAHQTVSPGKAAVTATGKAPVVARTQHQWVAPGKGAVAATGKQPTVARQANQWVVPDKGTVTHIGRQPTLTQGVTTTVAPGKGAVIHAGKQPSIARSTHQVVSPAAGAAVFTGRQPTVVRTAHQWVAPGKSALTVTGKTPVVLQGLTTGVAPDKGAIVYTGRQPTLAQTTHTVVQPGKAAAVYTGRQPAIVSSGHQTIIPSKGALLFTGYRPGVVGRQPIGRTPAGRIIAIGAPDRQIAIGPRARTVYVED
jgi:hypothetical protein